MIWQVAREKGFKLILMGYSYKKSLSEDYFTERGMVLSPSDFLTNHNQDPRKFLSYNGRHPNDMGYSFEATLLLHFFQRKGILSKAKNLVNFKPGMETFQLWRPWLESEIQSLKISLMNMANSTCLDLRHLLSLTYELSMVDRGLVDTDYEDLVKLLVLGCNDQLIARETLNAIQNQSPLPLPQPKAMESMLKVHIETISEGLLIRPQRLDQCLPKHLQFEITLALERSWRHLLGKISAGGDDTCGQISLRTNLKKK